MNRLRMLLAALVLVFGVVGCGPGDGAGSEVPNDRGGFGAEDGDD